MISQETPQVTRLDITSEITVKVAKGEYSAVKSIATSPVSHFQGNLYEMRSFRVKPEELTTILNDTNCPIILYKAFREVKDDLSSEMYLLRFAFVKKDSK